MTVCHIFMEWGQFFIHRDNIWQTLPSEIRLPWIIIHISVYANILQQNTHDVQSRTVKLPIGQLFPIKLAISKSSPNIEQSLSSGCYSTFSMLRPTWATKTYKPTFFQCMYILMIRGDFSDTGSVFRHWSTSLSSWVVEIPTKVCWCTLQRIFQDIIIQHAKA